MAYQAINPQVGYPIPQFGGLVADTTPILRPSGFTQAFADNWWGYGEFMYARAAGTIRAFGLCVITPVFDSTLGCYRYDVTEAPNTANLGRMICVASDSMASGDYGWFQISGLTPVNCQASVAADTTFGIAAAGQGGANSAGKQILNARVMVAAAATVAKTNCQTNGISTVLNVGNADGWFVGAYLSGTGVGAAAVVSAISPDGRTVTMSVASTAAISGTVTATYNNATVFYNVVHLNRPFAQGAIT